MKTIGIGLAGFGTVGAGVYENLERHRDLIAERSGYGFAVRRIIARHPKKQRDVDAPSTLFSSRWQDLLDDPEIRVVVELIGGTKDAFDLTVAAIRSGRIVVTGNKALLAERGAEIFALACEHRVPVFFEAAVAGGIPIIQSLRDAFVGNRIESIHGILNGTSNYILTRMQKLIPPLTSMVGTPPIRLLSWRLWPTVFGSIPCRSVSRELTVSVRQTFTLLGV